MVIIIKGTGRNLKWEKLKGINSMNKVGKFEKILIYNTRQNIWGKIEKSSKTGQDKKNLISTFACFLTAIANV